MATDRFNTVTGASGPSGSHPRAAVTPTSADPRSVYEDPGYGSDAALDAFTGQPSEAAPIHAADLHMHDVTAVLVAHNGSRWLPRTLEGLAALTHAPNRIYAVNTGSRDDTAQLLTDALGAPAVVSAPRQTGFGAAVARGLKEADENTVTSSFISRLDAERTEWIWLLHDDSVPAPDALRRLLEIAVRRPDAGVIGPKVLGWRADRQLLEVGLTISGSGRRHTGLDRREYDQGQHDMPKDVLAVGSAGMLIRRDVWDELGGFDPFLSVFRDDIDFCWRVNQADYAVVVCPEAVVYHAEAAAHGRRRLGATRHRPHLADRRNALYVMLVNSRAAIIPLLVVRLLLGGLARSFGFLLGKQPALALEEMLAVLAVVGRPDRIIRGRARRSRIRRRSHTQLRPLFPPRGQQLRNAGENLLGLLSGSGHDVPGAQRRASATGGDDDMPDTDDAFLIRLMLHPLVLAMLGLSLLALVASRDLIGAGRLMGGALLPSWTDPGDLWRTYTESWHGVGLGSPTPAPPYLAVIAAVGSVLRSATLAVDLLLLASVPLAGLTSFFLIRRLVRGRWLRLWGSVTYALLPAITGAVAAGRLGTTVATVLAPLLVLALYRTLGKPGEPGPFRAAWSAGLILAVMTAFVPLAWLMTLLLGVLGLATAYRGRPFALRVAATLAVAPVVLVPWSGSVVGTPVLLITEAGMPGPGLSDDAIEPWAILLSHPGGPGGAPVWLGAGLVLAGWAALLRSERRLVVGSAWAAAGTALVLGLLVSRLPVTGPTLQTPVSGWPGFPAVVVGGALIVAAVVAGEGAREWLARSTFGWRQPLVALATAGALLVPVIGAGWWITRGADDPLDRRNPEVLPAYIADEAEQPERIRTLVLSRADDGRVTYALLRSSGPRLGDAETGPHPEEYGPLDQVVADIVSGRGGADGARIAEFAAKYVYLTAPFDQDLADILDTVPGLVRSSAPEGAAMWRVDQPVGRLWLAQPQPEDGIDEAGIDAELVVLPSHDVGARTRVPAGPDGRLLVLSELADSGWSATLDGRALEPVVHDDWAQAFRLGPDGGQLDLTHQGTRRAGVLLIQLGAVVLAAILALPGMRRERGALDDASELDPEDPASPEPPVSPRPEATQLPEPVGARSPQPAPETPPPGTRVTYEWLGRPDPHQQHGPATPDPTAPNSATEPAAQPSATAQPPTNYRGRRARRSAEESSTDEQTYRGRRAAGRRGRRSGRGEEEQS